MVEKRLNTCPDLFGEGCVGLQDELRMIFPKKNTRKWVADRSRQFQQQGYFPKPCISGKFFWSIMFVWFIFS